MTTRTELIQQQKTWAESVGLNPDSRGYVDNIGLNLMKPLSSRTTIAFNNGSGSELIDTSSRPAKMRALHSSSALAVNVFDSWVDEDTSILQSALGIVDTIDAISFEEQFSTGLKGIPPNLDIALKLSTGHIVGIESKFSEWLTPKSKSKGSFNEKYFPDGEHLWGNFGLVKSQEMAEAIFNGIEDFRYLDAPQLLKHVLGMATQLEGRFSLYYIYYDWPDGHESRIHKNEVNRFAEVVGDELRFKAINYQKLFRTLDESDRVNQDYIEYLRRRYFS
jgi:hypothetical protein